MSRLERRKTRIYDEAKDKAKFEKFNGKYEINADKTQVTYDAFEFGLMSEKTDEKTYCREAAIFDPKGQNFKNKVTHCTDYLNKDYIREQILACDMKHHSSHGKDVEVKGVDRDEHKC